MWRSRGAIEEMRGEVMAVGIRGRESSAEEEGHLNSFRARVSSQHFMWRAGLL